MNTFAKFLSDLQSVNRDSVEAYESSRDRWASPLRTALDNEEWADVTTAMSELIEASSNLDTVFAKAVEHLEQFRV